MPDSPSATAAEVVYVLGARGVNVVKIGRTNNLERRLAAIQRMSPVLLTALWTHPGGKELERHLHKCFKDRRSHGEWFRFDSDPVREIRAAVELRLKERDRNTSVDAGDPVAQIISHLESIPDPIARLRELDRIDALRKEWSRRHLQEIALGLHDQGLPWRKVGEIMGGVSAQRAHQYAYGRAKNGTIIRT